VRVKTILLAWFRGAADPVALEADGRSMVIYGQNGAGKSSFVDAVEYVVNNGKLAHLTHEYSGRNQEKAIRNTHTPVGQNTEFWITFQDDSELHVRIAPNGTHARTGAQGINMEAWDYRRTVLRQDEVAEFIRSSKGGKYSALLPLFGLHELEVAAENVRQLARVAEQQSKLGQKQGALQQSVIKRKQAFGNDTEAAIEAKIAALHSKYCSSSKTTAPLARCNETEAALTQRINELSAENQRYVALRGIAETDLTGSVKAVRDSNAKLSGSVEPLIAEKLTVLQSADAFAEKLKEDGKMACPACGRSIPVGEFKAHVETEQERLQEILAIFEDRKVAISTLIDGLKTIKTTLAKPDLKVRRDSLKKGSLKANMEWIEQCNPEGFRQSLSEDDLKAIEESILPVIKATDVASQDAPPDIKDLSRDKNLAQAASAVFESCALVEEITQIEGLVAFIKSAEKGVRDEIRERSESVIKEISTDIGTMWQSLHPGEPIEDVRLYLPEDDKAIDIALKFHGKDQDSPRLTLSEGYRNSLGLCIFLAMAKHETATDRPLFLDDVVVSLDRNHRGMIVQLLEDSFARRQVIIFTHDRDWYAELRQQLDDNRWRFKALLPYETPMLGIRWSHRTTTFDDARAHLKDRPDSAGNDARKIMDVELGLITERLQIRLPYLRGDRNDKRMWSDFLDRLTADGKKCFQKRAGKEFPCHTDAVDLLNSAGKLLVSWGNKSSHSPDVMRPEAAKLIDACERALEAFKCASCTKPLWFADAGDAEWVQCQCGELRWRYGKS
jgi:energy-coupling factor transporter ATP-binding protein EcfA2